MNPKMLFRGIVLVLAVLVFDGCNSIEQNPQTTGIASQSFTPQTNPVSTAQKFSTQLPQLPVLDAMLYDITANYANIMITFELGDICKIESKTPIVSPQWGYEVVVNDNTYINYIVGAVRLNQGKTLADLEEYQKIYPNNVDPPPFVKQIVLYDIYSPMSRTFHGIVVSGDPLYIVCFVEGPGDEKLIEQFGPIELVP
jgi:hypothetical protein